DEGGGRITKELWREAHFHGTGFSANGGVERLGAWRSARTRHPEEFVRRFGSRAIFDHPFAQEQDELTRQPPLARPLVLDLMRLESDQRVVEANLIAADRRESTQPFRVVNGEM